MKFFLLIFFSILFSYTSNAQKKADSLREIWYNEKCDVGNRLRAMNILIDDYYLERKTDSALILANKMLNYAEQKKNLKYKIEAHTLIGEIYFEKEDNDKAIVNFNKGLELAKYIEDSIIYAKKLLDLGSLYYDYDDYANAFKSLQKSQKICNIVGDSLNEGWSIAYQGFIFRALGDLEQAEKYHLEHLQHSKKYGIKRSISGANGNLGGIYSDMGNIPKSIEHWKEGIKLSKELGLEAYASIGTSALIQIYIDEKQYEDAIMYLEEYQSVTKNFESPDYRLRIQNYQCQIDIGLGNYNKALEECVNCKENCERLNVEVNSRLLKSLYEVNKKLNKHKEALESFEEYQILINDEKEVKARTEIQNIVFNNQLAADSIAQAQEKELLNTTYEEGLRKKNQEKNFFLLIGLLVFLLALGLYNRLRFVRKSRKKLNIEKNRAEKSEQIKQDFLANMSHEIRTPMNAVMGMTDLALDMSLGDKQRYYLNGIKKAGDNLLHIINDILDLSKIDAGKMELVNIDFSIRDTVAQVQQMLQHRAQEKDLELLTIVDSQVNDIVIGDPMRLNQVLINLMGNAIKFTLKGSVTLEVRKVTEGVQFNIIDTGIGIPEDKIQAVFESFSQANTSYTRKYGGTGLGLSISQQLVEMMDSTIDIESKEGYGTTFSFVINFEKGSIESLNERNSKDETVDGSILDGLKILVVDDNEYNIIVARDTLKSKANVEIQEAVNGQEAIDLVNKNNFDVILMDVQMPVMNGFEATQYIRNNFESPLKDTPIIALTASVLRTDLDKCIDAGMNSYIPKPFKAYQLIGEIAEVLNIPMKKKKPSLKYMPEISSGDITDLTYLTNFCEGDKERIRKYIDMFLKSAPRVIEKIKVSLEDNDFEVVANHVHGFKTKSMMMGMAETKTLAISIEILCRENLDEELIKEEVSKLITNIEKAVNELRNYS